MTEIEALVWDVDGVLVDTEPLHFQGWKKLMEELGYVFEVAEYLPLAGHGGREILTHLCRTRGITNDIDELRARRVAIDRTIRAGGVPPIPANIRLVRQFAADFGRLIHATASSSYRAQVLENLGIVGLTELMAAVVCADDRSDIPRKPAPDLYLMAAERLNIPPVACLVFEDSNAGVRAAKAAGMHCVALPHTFTLGQDFSQADLMIAPGRPRDAATIIQYFSSK